MERELLGELGLADAGRTGKEKTSGRTIGLTETGPRSLDRTRNGAHGLGLTEHHAAERLFESLQAILVRRGRLFGRDARHSRDDFLHVLGARFRQPPPRLPAFARVAPVLSRIFAPASSIRSIALSGSL